MELTKLISTLEAAGLEYRIEDEMARVLNYDTYEYEMQPTGRVTLHVKTRASVYYWFIVHTATNWAEWRERYNCNNGKVLRSYGTMFRFIEQVEAGKIKQ